MPAALQTTPTDDDDSVQNNTGPLGGPVISPILRHWNDDHQNSLLMHMPAEHERRKCTRRNAADKVSPVHAMETGVNQRRLKQHNIQD